jgi:hypothetical protein
MESRGGSEIHPALFFAVSLALIQLLVGVVWATGTMTSLVASPRADPLYPLLVGSLVLSLIVVLIPIGFLCRFMVPRILMVGELTIVPLGMILRILYVGHKAGGFSGDAVGLILVTGAIGISGTCCFIASPVRTWCKH